MIPEGAPNFLFESTNAGPVAGVDEVGRGPMAGPVVAAAVILTPGRIPDGINDSKTLARDDRERLHDEILRVATVGLAAASVLEIDRINILRASLLAMQRAVGRLAVAPQLVLVDGTMAPRFACRAMTLVRGDSRSLSIAAASIVAKVVRDRLMEKLARRYPHYGWESNVGYCTADHRRAVDAHGPTRHHRRSFAPVATVLEIESQMRLIL